MKRQVYGCLVSNFAIIFPLDLLIDICSSARMTVNTPNTIIEPRCTFPFMLLCFYLMMAGTNRRNTLYNID